MANSISGKDGKREMICSFCGRSQSQVDQLIIGPGVNICKDCIDMCYSALYKDGNVPEPPRATPERRAAASRGHSGVFELIPWLLGRCATVQDARTLLDRMNLVDTPFCEGMPVASLHWMIADHHECITLESNRLLLRQFAGFGDRKSVV